MEARAAVGKHPDVHQALEEALSQLWADGPFAEPIDLVLVFAHPSYRPDFMTIAQRVYRETGTRTLAGCSGRGIVGCSEELEDEPAISLLAIAAPGTPIRAGRITQSVFADIQSLDDVYALTGVKPDEVKAWLAFVDPLSVDGEMLVATLNAAYPDVPVIGGLASGDPQSQRFGVFLNDEALNGQAIVVAIGDGLNVQTLVSQGALPFGAPWTVTAARGNVIETLGQRTAYQALIESLDSLPPEVRQRAQSSLLIGLAVDEQQQAFGPGDLLIRNLLAADPNSGLLAINAVPYPGQTVQFQFRDSEGADEELTTLLERARGQLQDQRILGALLCVCNGRGKGMFEVRDHDVAAVSRALGTTPVAGFFCDGEIGPVGSKNFLHGFTAGMAIFTCPAPSSSP